MTFYRQWHLLQVRRQLPCSDGFACLSSHPSLANRTGATIKGVVVKFHNCISKLRSVFARFASLSLQQMQLQKNCNFGTATSYHGLIWSQIETAQCHKVKLDSCRWEPVLPRQSSFVFCARSSAFLIVDLTFHGQWHLFQVRRQPPCSDRLACLGSLGSLHNRTGASFEVAVARFKNCSSTLFWAFSAFEPSRCLQQQELQLWDSYQLPWRKMVLNGPKWRLCSAKKKLLSCR